MAGPMMRHRADTGMETACLTAPAMSAKQQQGCTPMGAMVSAMLPVGWASATCSMSMPASFSHLANCGASALSIPPWPHLGVTTGNLYSMSMPGTAFWARHGRACRRPGVHLLWHGPTGEVRHRRQAHVQGPVTGAGLHGRDKGGLVARLAPAVDMPGTFTPEADIACLLAAVQQEQVVRIALAHGLQSACA